MDKLKDLGALKFGISLLVGALILAVVLKYVGLEEVYSSMLEAKIGWIFVAIGFYFIFFLMQVWRWSRLFLPFGMNVSFKNLFCVLSAGWLLNTIFPFRSGEFGRAILIGYKEDLSKSSAFSTIVVEKSLDLISIYVIIVFCLLFGSFWTDMFTWIKVGLLSGALVVGAGTFFLIIYPSSSNSSKESTQNFVYKIPFLSVKYKEAISSSMKQFILGIKTSCSRPYNFIAIVLLSLIVWIVHGLMFYSFLMGFNQRIPILVVMLSAMIAMLIFIIPTTPSAIGTFEAAWTAIFMSLGYQAPQVLTSALFFHFITIIIVVTLGVFSLSWLGLGTHLFKMTKEGYKT